MNRPLTAFRRSWRLLLLVLVTGCATTPPGSDRPAPVARPDASASAAPRTINGFREGLRCMDGLFVDYGVRDVAIRIDDLAVPAKLAGVNPRDMFAEAVSEMTRRSNALRLIGSSPLAAPVSPQRAHFLKQVGDQPENTALAPQFAVRGSLGESEDIVQRPSSATGDGALRPVAASLLGLSFSVVSTADRSVVPGVTARGTAVRVKLPRGGLAAPEIRKFGITYRLGGDADEGQAGAVRALVDVGAIELFGRLARVPYWTCLGASDTSEEVATELRDWFDAFLAQPAEIIVYFQRQLRLRGAYAGPVDGAVNPEFKDAVARTRAALGLSHEPKLTFDYFKAYLAADPKHIEAKAGLPAQAPAPVAGKADVAVGAAPAPIAPQPEPVPASLAATPSPAIDAAPLRLNVASTTGPRRFAAGERVQLTIRPSQDAHVYCYHQDETRVVRRIFPNRFQPDAQVPASKGITVPGPKGFEIVMNDRRATETVACFATRTEVLASLPAEIGRTDLEPLKVKSIESVRAEFVKSVGPLAQDVFEIRPR